MIANLKAKAEGIDRKRIYTVVAALVIAGAAGHIMQRGANDSSGAPALVASNPAQPEAADIQPAEPAPVIAAAALGAPTVAPGEILELAQSSPAQIDAQAAQEPSSKFTGDPEAVTRSQPEPLLALPSARPAAPEGDHASAEAMQGSSKGGEEMVSTALALAETTADPGLEPALATAICEIGFSAEAQAGALVALSISAPCNSGEDVEIHHAGLRFSEQLGPEGDLFLVVPALTENAVISAEFDSGEQKVTEVILPDFTSFERVALVWNGPMGLQLHALERGAAYGEPGHVWAESPGSTEAAIQGDGGFLSVLGSTTDGHSADVYTYPASLLGTGIEPNVSIEAQVMENTCGAVIGGYILRTNAGRDPSRQPLEMAVPGCDAVGEYLVLNNLPRDLKIARN